MNLIYVCSGDVSVFESQVLELLVQLQREQIQVSLLLGYKNLEEKESLRKKIANYPSIPVYWKKSYPCYPFFERSAISSLYKGLLQIPNFSNSVIHVRSEMTGYVLKKILLKKNLTNRVVVDIRGLVLEELRYIIHSCSVSAFRKFVSKIQIGYFKKVYAKFFAPDNQCNMAITSVSPLINKYIQKHYPSCNYTLSFHPNVGGSRFVYNIAARKKIRTELGVRDDELMAIASSGGGSVWQKDFMLIKHLSKMSIFILNLSKNDCGVNNVMTKTIPFAQMPDYLSAADMAILWRDDVLMNNVASPSKFSEFAVMGLYVIHNKSVAVATNYIRLTHNGLLLDDVKELTDEMLNKNDIFLQRQKRIDEGREYFSVENIVKSYIAMYKNS